MKHHSLKNKTFIVVGAGGLIGKEVVKNLQSSQAKVIAADYSKNALEKLRDSIDEKNVEFCEVNINSIDSIHNLVNNSIEKYSFINGAVNTAYPRNKNYGKDFLEVTHNDFSENLSLHLGGYFLFTQQCLKYSISNNTEFSLVNLSSIYGTMAPRFSLYDRTKMTMPVEYAAIKAALQQLSSYVTSYVKNYHKNTGFRVNCVSPGGILDSQPTAFLEKYNKHCLSKGMLEPHDIVDSILFLLSQESQYICGQNIIIDDGFSA
jgi:NAD(P)-dependent dehydrogenase (short-subunit alcohol dehydrogenase family)